MPLNTKGIEITMHVTAIDQRPTSVPCGEKGMASWVTKQTASETLKSSDDLQRCRLTSASRNRSGRR